MEKLKVDNDVVVETILNETQNKKRIVLTIRQDDSKVPFPPVVGKFVFELESKYLVSATQVKNLAESFIKRINEKI